MQKTQLDSLSSLRNNDIWIESEPTSRRPQNQKSSHVRNTTPHFHSRFPNMQDAKDTQDFRLCNSSTASRRISYHSDIFSTRLLGDRNESRSTSIRGTSLSGERNITNKPSEISSGSQLSGDSNKSNLSGDSSESRLSGASNGSLLSEASSGSQLSGASDVSRYSSAFNLLSYKVAVLGAHTVGKTSVIEQFVSSEYTDIFDIDNAGVTAVKTAFLLLGGEETRINFIEMSLPELCEDQSTDTYLVMYAINDRGSYRLAVDIMREIRKVQKKPCPIILVANKCDLARVRHVAAKEARDTASKFNCKFIETSALIDHNIDELRASVLSRIRPKQIKSLSMQVESCKKSLRKIWKNLMRNVA